MKVAVLGANWSLFAEAIDQAVVPATGLPSPSAQVKAAPPHAWTSIPRCRLYQACSAGASLALKKMPPMPVARFIEPPRSGGGEVGEGEDNSRSLPSTTVQRQPRWRDAAGEDGWRGCLRYRGADDRYGVTVIGLLVASR